MATIKCKSCGRAYNYRSSELCPKCGAFNRPPHRMRVGFNADGGVELQTEKEFVREAQRFDARDDVCADTLGSDYSFFHGKRGGICLHGDRV